MLLKHRSKVKTLTLFRKQGNSINLPQGISSINKKQKENQTYIEIY